MNILDFRAGLTQARIVFKDRGGAAMTILEALPYLSSGLALAGFLAALVLYAFQTWTKRQVDIISSVPASKRVAAIERAAEYVGVDLKDIPANERAAIVIEQLKIKSDRQRQIFRLLFLTAFLLFLIAAAAIAEKNLTSITKTISIGTEGGANQAPSQTQNIKTAKNSCVLEGSELEDLLLLDAFVYDLRRKLPNLHLIWGGRLATDLPNNRKSRVIDVHREDQSLVLRYDWQNGMIILWPTSIYEMSTTRVPFRGVWRQSHGGGCVDLDITFPGISDDTKGIWFENLERQGGWSLQLEQD
ncbi:hypothetical protein GR238_33725 [Rhizobium leguminosarum]|uniref:hypothetical protein n=1 Tax=Rhizobium ruizarguesonis TaxID=2081791 RepID=UPI0013B8AA8C|nr:hypothetical protein [Rhizobium ruizarguesonis]NEJ10330.1 hypothetical protein [Rhizobium ruizarguesonis]